MSSELCLQALIIPSSGEQLIFGNRSHSKPSKRKLVTLTFYLRSLALNPEYQSSRPSKAWSHWRLTSERKTHQTAARVFGLNRFSARCLMRSEERLCGSHLASLALSY